MDTPLYQTRSRSHVSLQPAQAFGAGPVMTLLAAFFLIHVNLAGRFPLILPEHLGFMEMGTVSTWLAQYGTSHVPGAVGTRFGFILLSVLTSILTFSIARRADTSRLAPALALIWLNTTLAFGLGSVLAHNAGIVVAALALMLWAGTRALSGKGEIWWLIAATGAAGAIATDPKAAVFVLGLAGLPLFGGLIGFARSFGFLAFLTISGFVLVLGLQDQAVPVLSLPQIDWSIVQGSGAMSLEAMAILIILLGPVLLALAIAGAFTAFRAQTGQPIWPARFLVLSALPGLVLMTWLSGPAYAALLSAPAVAVLAAIGACRAQRFFGRWLADAATPVSVLGFLTGMTLLAFPSNALLARLPMVPDTVGWPSLTASLQAEAAGRGLSWIASEGGSVANWTERLTGLPAARVTQSGPIDKIACLGKGLFVTQSSDISAVLGHFTSFVVIGQASRALRGQVLETYTIFEVGSPSRPGACG